MLQTFTWLLLPVGALSPETWARLSLEPLGEVDRPFAFDFPCLDFEVGAFVGTVGSGKGVRMLGSTVDIVLWFFSIPELLCLTASIIGHKLNVDNTMIITRVALFLDGECLRSSPIMFFMYLKKYVVNSIL